MTKEYHPDLVLGLDVLIGDPDILRPRKETKKKADCIYIPEGYIYRAEEFRKEQSSRGEACKELLSIFKEISAVTRGNQNTAFELKNGTLVRVAQERSCTMPKRMDKDSSRAQAISVALNLRDDYHDVAIMTGNDLMSVVAYQNNIDVAHVNPDVYRGRRKLVLPLELSNLWYGKGFIPGDLVHGLIGGDEPLVDNEYIEFVTEEVDASQKMSWS